MTEEFISEEAVEKPMQMNYRESVAWQLGWDKGFKAGVEYAEERTIGTEIKDDKD